MLLSLGVFSVLVALATGQELLPVVSISQGVVIGSLASTGTHYEYLGIPYADSTSGINRFKAPRPAPMFQNAFLANRRNIKCVRSLGVGYEGTEDCLVANIYTPTVDPTQNLPIMVWIKGREFDQPTEPPISFRNFVEKGVIVVTLNYRESILGFLCLGTETAPGNAGLKDIIAGLKWVKTNIARFGGNPNDITLFGHGSGAAAVDLVTMSPSATDLVQKAIVQSGNAIAPWAVSRDNLKYALEVAEALGHEVTTIQQLSEIFTRTSLAALMGVINDLDLTDNSLAFSPCVEREELSGVQPFLTKTPAEIIRTNEFLQIPMIIGYVDNEGTIRSEEALEGDWLQRMQNSFTDFLQPDLKFETSAQELEVARSIRTFYFDDDPIDMTSVDEYVEYIGDTMVLVSAIREARSRASVSGAPTYLYQFSYRGTLGRPFVAPIDVESAAHSEELAYMFYDNPPESTPTRDLSIGDILVERWTNFAKTGAPTTKLSQVNWLPYTSTQANFIRVLSNEEINQLESATVEILVQKPHPNTISFWDQIYETHFLDAQSNWDIVIRDEDDDDSGNGDDGNNDSGSGDGGSGDSGSGDGGSGDGGSGDGGSGEGSGEGSGDGDSSSASTNIGYTFLIVCLFTVLSQIHSSQMLS
ncbi:venom carboxylesterase-6-like [Helicoverpa zea]|uniref:venom carboxylesterase-6-like n=1 Tax=Helicoverpa zea TaxID=7113 RepID=UPI001F5A8A7F|nr:venom carboxylesterase-6-like [Helicoverpa zea]